MYKIFFIEQHWTRTSSLSKLNDHTHTQNTWQNTTLTRERHPRPGGIRNCSRSKQAASDTRLRI